MLPDPTLSCAPQSPPPVHAVPTPQPGPAHTWESHRAQPSALRGVGEGGWGGTPRIGAERRTVCRPRPRSAQHRCGMRPAMSPRLQPCGMGGGDRRGGWGGGKRLRTSAGRDSPGKCAELLEGALTVRDGGERALPPPPPHPPPNAAAALGLSGEWGQRDGVGGEGKLRHAAQECALGSSPDPTHIPRASGRVKEHGADL